MWYQRILISICVILLGILIYLQIRPRESGYPDYRDEIKTLQEKIDSLGDRVKREKSKVDSFTIVKEYYRETKEIQKEKVQVLPLDSAVELLRKNIITYEETDFIPDSLLSSSPK